MKKIFLILGCCFLLFKSPTHAQNTETPTHLVINQNDDYTFSILSSKKPQITFNNEICITTAENSYTFLLPRLKTITFNYDSSSIETTEQTESKITQQKDQLCFSTNKANTHISITDIKGNIIMSQVINSGNYYFPLSDLTSGIYIAKINNNTIKFIKQ